MERAVAILNHHSGRDDKRKTALELKKLAAAMGVQCEIVLARTPAQVAKAACSDAYDTVIAGGGDGTINAVASHVAGTGKRLGILPLGTFNYFARNLGLPIELEPAFRACFDGETRAVSIGEVNGRIFLNNASIGLYPMILSAREQTYRRWGRHRLGAYWSVLQTLSRRHSNLRLTITADGLVRHIRTPLMFIARNSYQLEEFNIPGLRCISDDAFSVFFLPPTNKRRLIKIAGKALARKLEASYDFEVFCATEFRIDSPRIGRTVAFDGERVKMAPPLEFRVRRQALRLAVPAATKDEIAA